MLVVVTFGTVPVSEGPLAVLELWFSGTSKCVLVGGELVGGGVDCPVAGPSGRPCGGGFSCDLVILLKTPSRASTWACLGAGMETGATWPSQSPFSSI